MYSSQYSNVPQAVAYGMPHIQAAAMAATAAASGTGYPSYLDTNLGQRSPTMGPRDDKRDPRSPNSIPDRRLSQVSSPTTASATQAASMLSHVRHPVGTPTTATAIPEPPSAAAEETPLYVNAKQFHRILKRRVARQRLEEQLRLTNKGRKPYLHESRHNHAMRRPRGPGGRFLTADEVAALDAKAAAEGGEGLAQPPSSTTGKKRKSLDSTETTSKKVKTDG